MLSGVAAQSRFPRLREPCRGRPRRACRAAVCWRVGPAGRIGHSGKDKIAARLPEFQCYPSQNAARTGRHRRAHGAVIGADHPAACASRASACPPADCCGRPWPRPASVPGFSATLEPFGGGELAAIEGGLDGLAAARRPVPGAVEVAGRGLRGLRSDRVRARDRVLVDRDFVRGRRRLVCGRGCGRGFGASATSLMQFSLLRSGFRPFPGLVARHRALE